MEPVSPCGSSEVAPSRAGWRWRYIEIGVRCAPIIITPSEWLANELAERYQRDRRDFRVIPCGIGDHWFETPSRPGERKPRVALVNMKGVDVALRAFARIAGQVDAELWLYGTHRDPAALEKLAGELRIGERTHFAGFVANEALPAQLAGARLLVHPTESESFGQVLAEAAALGIPSVATRVNATPEVIEHGATGYLCTPGEVDDFAARMLQILQRPELARSLGAAAQRRARARWRWDSVAGQLENEVYLPLTDSAQAAQAEFDQVDNYIMRCETKGMPASMATPNPYEFIDEEDTIRIRGYEGDVVRIVHLDDSIDPATRPASRQGFSIGQWEDERTLVVSTSRINFPYLGMTGIPLSDAVEVIERYSLSEDQTRLDFQFTVTDSVAFTEPATYEYYWLALGETFGQYDCDVH